MTDLEEQIALISPKLSPEDINKLKNEKLRSILEEFLQIPISLDRLFRRNDNTLAVLPISELERQLSIFTNPDPEINGMSRIRPFDDSKPLFP